MPTNADYAKIHIAIKDLGLSDDDYRGILQFKFKVDSAKDLKPRQVTVLLNHFRAKGWKPKAPKKAGVAKLNNNPQIRKIRALWLTMHDAGMIKNPSELALAKYVQRLTRVDRLEWCSTSQLSRVIEALKKWQVREELQAAETMGQEA